MGALCALSVPIASQITCGGHTKANHYGAEPKGDVSGGRRTEELAKWIDDYCHKNPTDNFYGATAALIRKFQKIDSP